MTSLPETTTTDTAGTDTAAGDATPGTAAVPDVPAVSATPATPQGWARKRSTAPTGSIPEHERMITDARGRIDAIDDRIIGLIQERSAVSAVVQKARVEAGGRRVNLSREMEVLSHYRDALGKQGTALAMTLLELSRGRA
ncbi:chorismate mutase [Streptomyces sp. SID11385]|uniref:chorismate mutase n=1 Tax=Streptomyces sp. SID11385 TaxID=2706031 RepID=UPI0013C5F689|nr:chorismate mutase [Streptomyces sp. SID11385]NEA40407.1 chorismate mutase [Streptomyces sp. SID11385]